MARPGWPERNKAARSFRQLRRFDHVINSDKVFGTHSWEIHPQVGVSFFRVDLGVVHPDFPGRYLAGVECDGATYHRSATARDRDRLREMLLNGLGCAESEAKRPPIPTEIDRFLNSRLIFDNFVVDFDGSKIHHAVGTERSADEMYFAIHYLVSLTDGRLSLPEYAKFRGMRCEVQLQTILNHAWAETSHDIVYHPTPIEGFGTTQFAAIKNVSKMS